MIPLRAAAITDIGRMRRSNEDRFLCDSESGLFAVADGVGGLPGGARAAQTAIETLRAQLTTRATHPFTSDSIDAAVQKVNQAVAEVGHSISPEVGIGCTLTCGVVVEDQLIIGHVGDSCCWAINGTTVTPLTNDHNVGRALAEHFVDHPMAQEGSRAMRTLTQCIGQPIPVRVDTIIHPLLPGTKILFASDGVSGVLSPAEIAEILESDLNLPQQLATLIDAVNARGAPDNATAVVLSIS